MKSSETGPATTIITGFAKGMESTTWPVLIISVAIFISYQVAELYGIAIAAVGMLRRSVSPSPSTYGPIRQRRRIAGPTCRRCAR